MISTGKIVQSKGYNEQSKARVFRVALAPFGTKVNALYLPDAYGSQRPIKVGMNVLVIGISHPTIAAYAIFKVYYTNNDEYSNDDWVLYTADGSVYLGDGKKGEMEQVMCYDKAHADLLALQEQIDIISTWAAVATAPPGGGLVTPIYKAGTNKVTDGGKPAVNVKVKPE